LLRQDLEATRKHAGGKVMHVGSLEAEVPQHHLGLPPPNKLDEERINSRAEKGHCTSGTEDTDGNLMRLETKLRHEMAGMPQHGSEPVTGNLGGGTTRKKHSVEWSVRRCIVLAEMMDLAKDGMDWRHKDLLCGAMGKLFTRFAIILLGECEEDLVGGQDEVQITGGCIIAGVAVEEIQLHPLRVLYAIYYG
jgi:hypothetical protein